MENLIAVLQQECAEYNGLLELSGRKTPIIVAGDLDQLQKITDEEQEWVGRIAHLEKKRSEITADIADVLNKDVKTMKLRDLVQMLSARPAEQKQLSEACDVLREAVDQVQAVNERNRDLIQHSLELVEFDMNLLQSMRTAPQTANYNREAYNAGAAMGIANPGFDAKQ
ncbi:MAG: flagellar protein FlgN [Lachnospiraceae bacterium]|nr:flagellar protein FlgN [Lachnospiraceae bacterium]